MGKDAVAIPRCFLCNEPKEIILMAKSMRKMKNGEMSFYPDMEKLHDKVVDREPCDKCKGFMKQGIILISCKSPVTAEDRKNPFRTGGWLVVSEDAVKNVFKDPSQALKMRAAFIDDETWEMIGLPLSEYQMKQKEMQHG